MMKLQVITGRQTVIWTSVILLTVAGLLMPLFMRSFGNKTGGDMAAVFAAASNHHTISEAIRLSSQPSVTVLGGTLSLPKQENGNDGTAMMSRLAHGTAALVISNAVISVRTLDKPTQEDVARRIVAPLASALSQLRLDSLVIQSGEILVQANGSAKYRLEAVDAVVKRSSQGALSAQGSFSYRNQELSFKTELGLSQAGKISAPVPIRAQIKGRFGEASFSGKLVRDARTQLIADNAQLNIHGVGETARWLGLPWSNGSELGGFAAKGKFNWTGEAIAFEDSVFDVAGNAASGTLSINFEKQRPSIEGTLAFNALDLGKFVDLDRSHSSEPSSSTTKPFPEVGSSIGGVLDALKVLNADLRISAESVSVGSINIANSAATLSLQNGKMLADLAELGLGPAGRGDVKISVDVQGDTPIFGIRGRLENADIEHLLQLVFYESFLSGSADAKIDITSRGATRYEFLRSMSGGVDIRMKKDAVLALDILELLDAKRRGISAPGWGGAKGGTTRLDDVDLQVSVADGVATADKISARTAGQKLIAQGTIELHSKALDLLIRSIEPDQSADRLRHVFGLHAQGHWEKPHIVTRERAETGAGTDIHPILPNGRTRQEPFREKRPAERG